MNLSKIYKNNLNVTFFFECSPTPNSRKKSKLFDYAKQLVAVSNQHLYILAGVPVKVERGVEKKNQSR